MSPEAADEALPKLLTDAQVRVDDVNFDMPAYTALRNERKDVETVEREEVLFASRADTPLVL